MKLIAIRPVYRGGGLVEPGNPFETTDEDGAALVALGEARAEKAPAKPKAEPKADTK